MTSWAVTPCGVRKRVASDAFPEEAGKVSVGPLTRYAYYTFTVRAVDSVGTSKPSNAGGFTVDR